METTAITNITETKKAQLESAPIISPFSSVERFEISCRMAKCLAASSLVPESFTGNIANCMLALELASRFGYSPFMIMQNLYLIHGRPGFSSQFIIAAIQSCGRYSALHYRWTTDSTGKKIGCRAEATELATGETLTGAEVTLDMAKKEGWSTKNGSKWLSMPEQMMMYRAAAFFGRLYAPDILLGMQAEDELSDIYDSQAIQGKKMTADFEPVKKRNFTEELNNIAEAAENAPSRSKTDQKAEDFITAEVSIDEPELTLKMDDETLKKGVK